MILIKGPYDRLINFIQFLQDHYPVQDNDVTVQLIPDCDAVQDDEGNAGFAVYLSYEDEENTILLPLLIPESVVKEFYEDHETPDYELDFTFHNLAHEYRHYMQQYDSTGTMPSLDELEELEEDANTFADKVINEFKIWESMYGE